MFLNLSNHPSPNWSAAQLSAARAEFGKIADLPFPVVPPEWEIDKVDALAGEFVDRCIGMLANHPPPHAVHVMGEMTFTCAFVARMDRSVARCVASTTERIVQHLPGGDRRVSFRFVRFRDYPA